MNGCSACSCCLMATRCSSPSFRQGNRWSVGSNAQIVARSLKTGARKLLVKGASDGWYVATGHLLYMIEGRLHAVSFDPSRLEISGPAVAIVEGVRRASLNLSGLGCSVCPAPARSSTCQDRRRWPRRKAMSGLSNGTGHVTALKLPPAPYRHPRVSPDGKRIVAGNRRRQGCRRASLRLPARRRAPAASHSRGRTGFRSGRPTAGESRFSQTGKAITASSGRPQTGAAHAERLTTAAAGERHIPESWHPGGDVLLFSVAKDAEYTLWTYSVAGQTDGAIRRRAFGDPDRRHLLTGWEMGRVYEWTVHDRDHLHAAVPAPRAHSTNCLARAAARRIIRCGPPTRRSSSTSVPETSTLSPSRLLRRSRLATPVSGPRKFHTGPPNVRRTFDVMPDGRLVGLFGLGTSTAASPPAVHRRAELAGRVEGAREVAKSPAAARLGDRTYWSRLAR